MDDLLALMETSDEVNSPTSQQEHSTHRNLNDKNKTKKYDAEAVVKLRSEKLMPLPQTKTCLSSATGTIDPLTKIRIVARRTSRVELVDLLSPYQFHNTAVLAFMSKYDIANLITQPLSLNNIDQSGGVGGKTSMATMGIVFTNSGTRISSNNGRAFTIITIGDLNTGPTVTIMLFGQAYSKFTTIIQPGTVLAVLGSNILPSKQGDSSKRSVTQTRITLSVRDTNQLVLVGKALDYGLCSGMTNKREYPSNNRYGGKGFGGDNEKVRCKNYVDLRMGRYCKFHAKQQNEKNFSGAASKTRKNTTLMQSLREKHHSTINRPGLGSAKFNMMKSRLPQQTSSSVIGKCNNVVQKSNYNSASNSVSLEDSLAMVSGLIFNNGSGTTTTGYISAGPVPKSQLQRSPMHMKMASGSLESKQKVGKIHNPYSKAAAIPSLQTSNSTRKSKKSIDPLGQALGLSRSDNPLSGKHLTQTNLTQKRKRNIVHMEGYDGHVQVPKPHNLFRRVACPSNNVLHPATYISPPDKVQVLNKQKGLAFQMKQQRGHHRPSNNSVLSGLIMKSASPNLNGSSAEMDKIFGGSVKDTLSAEQCANILSAKSRYSTEADAEIYAKARRLVNSLEKKENAEELRQARAKKARGHTKKSSIIVEWHCVTCQRRMSHKPITCVSNGHVVKRKRDIKGKIGVEGDRLKLSKQNTADGGMVLGTGLEWSGWRGA